MSFNTTMMHKKPTYEELIRQSRDPNDKISLPDRMATQLRNTPQMTKFDDDTHLNLVDEQNKITTERLREIEVRNLANNTTNNYYNTTNVSKANNEDTTTTPGAPPTPPPPPAAKPQMHMAGTQTKIKQTQSTSTATGSGDGFPQGHPYFGGHQPPPPAPPAPTTSNHSPSFDSDEIEARRRQNHMDMLQFLEEQKRNIAEARRRLVQENKPQATPTVAEQMADITMGTGGGGPPPPPPGAAGFVQMEVEHIDRKTKQPETFRIDSPRGKRGGKKPGPPPPPMMPTTKPRYEPVQPAPLIQPIQQPIHTGSKQTAKSKKSAILKDALKNIKITIGNAPRKGKKTEPEPKDGLPTPPPAPPPAPAPPPPPPPPPAPPTLKIKFIQKQKQAQTRAEKRKAAADAIQAASTAADASAILLPDDATPPKKQKTLAKRKPKPVEAIISPSAAPEPSVPKPKPSMVKRKPTSKPPDPEEPQPKPAVAKVIKPRAIAQVKKPKMTEPRQSRALPTKVDEPEVQISASSSRGPGPEAPAGKKAKKTEKPIADDDDDELPISKSIPIKPPGQAKVPDQIAAIKIAIKGKELDEEQLKKFRKIEKADDSEDPLDTEEKRTLKDLYKEAVYDRAKPQKGGGRRQAIY